MFFYDELIFVTGVCLKNEGIGRCFAVEKGTKLFPGTSKECRKINNIPERRLELPAFIRARPMVVQCR